MSVIVGAFFFLMIRRPPRSTRTDTLFPYTTLFRSIGTISGVMIAPTLVPALKMPVASARRSEEHTSELQSLMRNSYAVFCLKKKNIYYDYPHDTRSYDRGRPTVQSRYTFTLLITYSAHSIRCKR